MTGHIDSITIGVLALQGAFVEHITLLHQAARSLERKSQNTPLSSDFSFLQRRPPVKTHHHAAAANSETQESLSHATTAPSQAAAAGVKNDQRPNFSHNQAETSPHSNDVSTTSSETISMTTTTTNDETHSQRSLPLPRFEFIQVRTALQLQSCDALILPGGESTSISLIAERCNLLEPLRIFVKVERKPVWGTCAGLILLAESANKSKETGQELIGGLDVRVQRNYFGRQVESFEAELQLPFLQDGHGDRQGRPFRTVFIRAPVVEKILNTNRKGIDDESAGEGKAGDTVLAPPRQATNAPVDILGRLPGRARAIRDKTTTAEGLGEEGDIVAVKQGNVFGTAFHPELTGDERIHAWWLREVIRLKYGGQI